MYKNTSINVNTHVGPEMNMFLRFETKGTPFIKKVNLGGR